MAAGDGCHGGDANLAYGYMHENDVTDETCSIYQVGFALCLSLRLFPHKFIFFKKKNFSHAAEHVLAK